MNEKIRPTHLERAAYVYIRQSTLNQVRNHQESRRRQYDLEARARELGFTRVVVIDEDLGISGSGSRERPGFGRLLAAVCEGQVGAVLALEASRLARNNRDWHHLIDLCILTDTLVIDGDGVYDPRQLNDRLVLGLKGTMSEFELGLLRQRAQEALREKVRRGEVLTLVPVGYLRTETNGVEMSPDRQIQEGIRGVFAQFKRLASVRQVLLWHRQENVLLPALRTVNGEPEVVWEAATYNRVLSILKNPIYAGAFVYGRTTSRSRMIQGRARKTQGHELPLEHWAVLIRDHHPGYISWEEYGANQRQMSSNLFKHHLSGPGAAKNGSALLTGLLRCSRCGRKLQVGYTGKGGGVTRYLCRGANHSHGREPCISLGGIRLDQAVVGAVLEALQPLGIQASLRALENSQQEQDRKRKSLDLVVQKTRYEAERARRQYEAVDPENRLVAAELESRWNTALERVAQAEAQLQALAASEPSLSEKQRQGVMELGSDLKALWDHPDAPPILKKRILRTVINEIMVEIDTPSEEVCLRLHWAGGAHTTLRLPKNHSGCHRHATEKPVIDLVQELALVCDDRSIAAILNRLGYRTGVGNTWTEGRVKGLRDHRHIAAFDAGAKRLWVTMTEAAEQLKVSPRVVRTLIERELLPARQVVSHAPWCIQPGDLQLPEVQRYISAVHRGKKAPRADGRQTKMAFL
jgi:DNA invertase Pin-like site-specific DNA recombinase